MPKKLTDEQVLAEAIEKACRNGYKLDGRSWTAKELLEEGSRVSEMEVEPSYVEQTIGFGDYPKVIFSHPFAKALFGNDFLGDEVAPKVYTALNAWRYHLQQMVLEPNPIDYLRKYLEGGGKLG